MVIDANSSLNLKLGPERSVEPVSGESTTGAAVPQSLRIAMVAMFSVLSGLVVAFVVSAIEIATDFAVYGFSVAFVVPVGAIGCGFVAAAGFYEASKVLHVRPTTPMLSIPLGTAAATFVASHWFTFTRYEVAVDRTFADVMSFTEYLRAVTTETGLSYGSSGSVDRLGSLGYVVTAIEIVGFALGGWLAATVLQSKPWCQTSARFMQRVDHRKQMFDSEPPFHHAMAEVSQLVDHGEPVAASEVLPAKRPSMSQNRKGQFSLEVDRYECADCGCVHPIITTHERTRNNWQQTSRSPVHPQPLDGFVSLVS